MFAYSSAETRQEWQLPGVTAPAAGRQLRRHKAKSEDAGAAFWLPGGVFFQMTMVEPVHGANSASNGAHGDDEYYGGYNGNGAGANGNGAHMNGAGLNGNGASSGYGASGNGNGGSQGAAPRGLLMTFGWLAREDTMVLMEREYDSEGQLADVRNSTAVRGGWSGGRM